MDKSLCQICKSLRFSFKLPFVLDGDQYLLCNECEGRILEAIDIIKANGDFNENMKFALPEYLDLYEKKVISYWRNAIKRKVSFVMKDPIEIFLKAANQQTQNNVGIWHEGDYFVVKESTLKAFEQILAENWHSLEHVSGRIYRTKNMLEDGTYKGYYTKGVAPSATPSEIVFKILDSKVMLQTFIATDKSIITMYVRVEPSLFFDKFKDYNFVKQD